MLKNKKILLAVSGSISFYKAYELLSLFKKAEAKVYVALSNGVLEFCSPVGFEALSENKVLCEKTKDWTSGLNHIDYSKVDLVVIAPASTNTINKLANGICDNVFMETLIASKAPLVIAPAANTNMLDNPATKRALEQLREDGAYIVKPVSKRLACGDFGNGALASVENIFLAACRAIKADEFYHDKKVVVTAGPTIEKLDDVRAITNLSSGKMGRALADAFYLFGADVTLISSVTTEAPYKIVKFESSVGLESALTNQKLKKGDIIVMAAAVSDFIPVRVRGKISKDEVGSLISLNFKQNKDIISTLKFDGVKKIGFKLETDKKEGLKRAKNMLKDKNLDAVCLNVLDEIVQFGSSQTRIVFIANNKEEELALDSKANIAFKIAELIKSL